MTDPMAVNGNEITLNEAGLLVDASVENVQLEPVKPRYVRIARYVSNILSPAPVSLPVIILVSFYQTRSIVSTLIYSAITLFFLSIGPFLYIFLGVRLGRLSDMDVSKRTQRLGPFIFGLISVCLGWLVLTLIHAPDLLILVLAITAVSGFIMMLTTLWWKISIHASSLAGAATVLTVLYGTSMLPTFGLLVLVSWSRVVLRRHTVAQVVAGALVGIALTASLLRLRGW
jgi:membrane-associated phospholipid phosphatase